MMTRTEQFAKLMAVLLTTLPGRESSPELLDAYWRAVCSELTDAEFEAAVERALKSCRWLPTPAELIALARPGSDPAFLAGMMLREVQRVQGKVRDTDRRAYYSGRAVYDELGLGAYQAFHASGGAAAIEQLLDDYHGPGIRRRFLECFERVVQQDRTLALPPAPVSPLEQTPDQVRKLIEGIGTWPRSTT